MVLASLARFIMAMPYFSPVCSDLPTHMRPTGHISNTIRKIKGGGSRIYSYIAIAFLSGSSSYFVRAQRVLLMELSMFQFQPDMIHIVVQHTITKACLFTSGRVRGCSSRDTPTSTGVSFDMLIDTMVEPLLLTLEWPMYDGRSWSLVRCEILGRDFRTSAIDPPCSSIRTSCWVGTRPLPERPCR
ncbi:hypothetical protein EV401DRAFT_1203159 [Pisolithus croceorrhizus]|nr:hypothetical protein EV401DRAFT_1203159 [Pisolithus croceorrhizus]